LPKLVCRACGQGVYTTAPFEQLFADERRCPRCGHLLFSDRRTGLQRRKLQRRQPVEELAQLPAEVTTPTNGGPIDASPTNAGRVAVGPGPGADATGEVPDVGEVVAATMTERRVAERRQIRRRRDDNTPFQRVAEEAGWVG
jgi:hypothetical protein